MKNKIQCDYNIFDNELIIESLYLKKEYRRKGYASLFLKELEDVAKNNNCNRITPPSDLSKMALSFWIKNDFQTLNKNDKKNIHFVMNSDSENDYIFDIDCNTVVELYKIL